MFRAAFYSTMENYMANIENEITELHKKVDELTTKIDLIMQHLKIEMPEKPQRSGNLNVSGFQFKRD